MICIEAVRHSLDEACKGGMKYQEMCEVPGNIFFYLKKVSDKEWKFAIRVHVSLDTSVQAASTIVWSSVRT